MNKIKNPLISIIIPCYKMGYFISEALDSVATQTYKNWEVIAVDDCGPEDGTKTIIETFANKSQDHRVIYHRHEKNRGVSAARNTAIGLARGEYLAFLDPDDIWLSNHLERHMGIRDSGSHAPVTASSCRLFDSRRPEENLGEWKTTPWEAQLFPVSLVARNSINPSCVVAEKQVIIASGGFDESPCIQHVEDWDLWWRLSCSGVKFGFLEETTVKYRRHQDAAALQKKKMEGRISFFYEKHHCMVHVRLAEYMYVNAVGINSMQSRIMQLENNIFVRIGRIIKRMFLFK